MMTTKQLLCATLIIVFVLFLTSCKQTNERKGETLNVNESLGLVYPIKEWNDCISKSNSNSIECLRQIENSIKEKLSKYVDADSLGVSIKLSNGSVKNFVNGSCENADSCVIYTLFGYIPKLDMFVLVIHYWESFEIGVESHS